MEYANREQAKKLIVQECSIGLKATELPARLPIPIEGVDLVALIQELIDEGSLIEIEYVLPGMPYRAKSFLLPAGTYVSIKRGN